LKEGRMDEIDLRILRALMEDGRMPYQEIAERVSVSAPTVSSRVQRLIDTGLIKRISPILDLEKLEDLVLAFVDWRTEASSISDIIGTLAEFDQVRAIYTTTGDYHLLFTVSSNDLKTLQQFLTERISIIPGVYALSCRVVTHIAKDEPGIPLSREMGIRLFCDECGKEIEGRPEVMNVGGGTRFFCCKTCRSAYREKYGSRIRTLNQPET